MEQVASKFESTNSAIQGMLSSLMGQLEPLHSRWAGAGGMSFTQVKTAWGDDMKKISQALTETADAVRTSGQKYTSTDDSAQQRMAATHQPVNLPL
jgi:WXG100 family type VII secretion target